MTRARQLRYATEYRYWHIIQERIARRLVLSRMAIIRDRLKRSLASIGPEQTGRILSTIITEDDIRAMLRAIYVQVGIEAAKAEYNRLTGKKSATVDIQTKDRVSDTVRAVLNTATVATAPVAEAGFFSALWQGRMANLLSSSESAKRITNITAVTRQRVRDVLTRGASENWSIARLTKKVAGLFTGKSGRTRAALIARTETTRAANVGHEMGASATRLKLKKRWIATSDARTRDAHRAMLGSAAIGKDELFSVGGTSMKYPGDPAGGAANCCHCRCRVLYVPA
jgi:hypothetical protein